jgi:hypothetical protein
MDSARLGGDVGVSSASAARSPDSEAQGRHSLSASILTVATPFIVITPLIFIAIAFGRQW